MRTIIRIATRKSPLALWQANFVKQALCDRHPNLIVEFLGILTTADKMLTTPLNKIGGKGLFVKELETAILENRADIAVHSIKDMPAKLPDGLELSVICKREDPRDVFISKSYQTLFDLPKGSTLGTSSLRRKAQVLALRSDLEVRPLRGNVGTRLRKLDNGEFDGIILAAAGVKRLKLGGCIQSYFDIDQILPAAGQGAIGIESRYGDKKILSIMSCLNDIDTSFEVTAERALTAQLDGSCQLPIAAHAVCNQETLTIKGLVGDCLGKKIINAIEIGPKIAAKEIGLACAQSLISQGALDVLP